MDRVRITPGYVASGNGRMGVDRSGSSVCTPGTKSPEQHAMQIDAFLAGNGTNIAQGAFAELVNIA